MMMVCLTADAMVSYHMACMEFLYIVDCRRSATAVKMETLCQQQECTHRCPTIMSGHACLKGHIKAHHVLMRLGACQTRAVGAVDP